MNAEKRAIRAMAWWLAFTAATIADAAIEIGWPGAEAAFAAAVGAFFAGLVAIPSAPKDGHQ